MMEVAPLPKRLGKMVRRRHRSKKRLTTLKKFKKKQ
jgi:hypothetical protein